MLAPRLVPRSHRLLGLTLVLCTLVTACGSLAPAAATPSPEAQPAAAGRGNGGGGGAGGGGGGGRAAQANGQGNAQVGQGTGDGQGQGQGQTRGGGGAGGPGSGGAGGPGAGGPGAGGPGAGGPGAGGSGAGGPGGGQRGDGAGGPRGGGGAGQAQATGSPNAVSPIVAGEVDIVEGRLITVATNTGWRKLQIPESATIQTEGRGTAADLAPGAKVGVTGKPDGTAVSIRIFPQGANPRTGQFPMNGAQASNIMTNASIVSFDGKAMALDYDGQAASITVTADTEIVKPVPAALTDIVVGVRIQANGTVTGDTVAARTVTVQTGQAGQSGQRPGRS
jgi:hypothetical protein